MKTILKDFIGTKTDFENAVDRVFYSRDRQFNTDIEVDSVDQLGADGIDKVNIDGGVIVFTHDRTTQIDVEFKGYVLIKTHYNEDDIRYFGKYEASVVVTSKSLINVIHNGQEWSETSGKINDLDTIIEDCILTLIN